MHRLSERLDKVASVLEEKGLIKEAEELDVISNTIEAKRPFGQPLRSRRDYSDSDKE